LFLLPIQADAADAARTEALSPALGEEIDTGEREAYHLVPSVEGFISARFLAPHGGDRPGLEFTLEGESGGLLKRFRLSRDMWETAKLHVGLVETYADRRRRPVDPRQEEAEWQYRTALKYAARGRYDFSRLAVEDLFAEFSTTAVAEDALEARAAIHRLAETRRALFLPGSMIERSGRTDLLVFAGSYGLWAGLATPYALKAESAQAYAGGLILGVPASLAVAHRLSRTGDVSRGRASMISLGGHLGTWQGLGWAALSDAQGERVVGTGLLAGLGGIAAAALLTKDADVTEGHGALSGLSLPWGAWFGLVAGIVAGAEGDRLLTATLVGSDIAVLGALVGARGSTIGAGRARLISLLGIAGGAFGFGIDLLGEVEEEEAAFGIAGAGSILGLTLGTRITRGMDAGARRGDRSGPASPP
jgi:hypothetical protein